MSVPAIGFYITGGTVQRDAPCYVERQADAALYQALMQGSFCYVLTSRQMGKSSLMVRTAVRLREEGSAVAVLDLTAIGQNLNPEQWYNGLLDQVGQRLDLEDELDDFAYEHKQLSPLQRWMRAIREVLLVRYSGKVVVFVDEIDAVRSLPFSTDEFFAGIREFYNARTEDPELERLTFCLLGVATPSDLIRDTRTTPFNIGRRIELDDFNVNEAASLAKGLMREERLAGTLLQRVLYWTGGHPYLTQRLCQGVAEDRNIDSTAGVDDLCAKLFFSHRAQERDDNLLFVRERILRSDLDLAGLLDLYSRVYKGKRVQDDHTNPMVSLLRLSGITRVENGSLKVRNRIYQRVFDRDWIRVNMPDAELRRQKTAFYRGVMRATAVSLVILGIMSVLVFIAIDRSRFAEEQRRRAVEETLRANEALKASSKSEIRAIEQQKRAEQQREEAEQQKAKAEVEKGRAERQEFTARRLLYASQINLSQQAWENGNVGRTLELLEAQRPGPGQEDLRGFEWHYLWNLSHSDLLTLEGVVSVAFSPDKKIMATGNRDGSIKIWNLADMRELKLLKGHNVSVLSLFFSPDSRLLVSGSKDKTAKLWDVATGQELITSQGYTGSVLDTISPDGKRLALGSLDKTVKLWDLDSRKEIVTLTGFKAGVDFVSFSPDSRFLASKSEDGKVKFWKSDTGQFFKELDGKISLMIFSPQSDMVITAGTDGHIGLWHMITGQKITDISGHKDSIWSMVLSPDGSSLATCSREDGIKLWDLSTLQERFTITRQTLKEPNKIFTSLAFSPDGRYLASGSFDSVVRLFSVKSGLEWHSYRGHTMCVDLTCYSPDGRFLVTRNENYVLKLWDATIGQEAVNFYGHSRSKNVSLNGDSFIKVVGKSLHFSPDGKNLTMLGVDKAVRVWDPRSGRLLKTYNGYSGEYTIAAISPNGKYLIIGPKGTMENGVKLWDLAAGRELRNLKGHTDLITSVAFSADGKIVATGSLDKTIKLWDIATGRVTMTLAGQMGPVTSLAFSGDGKRLAAAIFEKGPDTETAVCTVKIWDTSTRRELATSKRYIGQICNIAFSPDNKWLAFGSGHLHIRKGQGEVHILDAATGQVIANLRGHYSAVQSVAFSPDGKRLASGSNDMTVKLWDLATLQELISLKGHIVGVRYLEFSPDGKLLVSGSDDNTARIWRTSLKD
jgi:WD40 repeat protein